MKDKLVDIDCIYYLKDTGTCSNKNNMTYVCLYYIQARKCKYQIKYEDEN